MVRYVSQHGDIGVSEKTKEGHFLYFVPLDLRFPLVFENVGDALSAAYDVMIAWSWQRYVDDVKAGIEVPDAALRHKLIEIASARNGHWLGDHRTACLHHQQIGLTKRKLPPEPVETPLDEAADA